MLVAILGVVKLFPVATAVPPVGALYQTKLPTLEDAFKTTEPVPQRLAGVVEVTTGIAFIVAVIAVLMVDIQVPLHLLHNKL